MQVSAAGPAADDSQQLLRKLVRGAAMTASKATALAVLRLGLAQVDTNSMQGLIVQVGADACACKLFRRCVEW